MRARLQLSIDEHLQLIIGHEELQIEILAGHRCEIGAHGVMTTGRAVRPLRLQHPERFPIRRRPKRGQPILAARDLVIS
jgi:hypothetical protein